MPILLPTPPGPSLPPAEPAYPPQFELAGAGDSIGLSQANGLIALDGLQGFDLAPVAVTASTPGGWDGGLLEHVRWGPRDVFLPMFAYSRTTAGFHELKQRLTALVSPKRGLTTVNVANADGTRRSISGVYVDGLNTPLGKMEGVQQQRLGVLIRCYDPAWLGPETIAAEYRLPSPDPLDVFLSSPFLPMTVTGSQAFGDITIVNEGDEDAYPIITVTGPGDDFLARNGDESWGIDGAIAAGETITVDARRGHQSVLDQAGASQWSRMSTGAVLWALHPGANEVELSIVGATADTRMTVTYRPRFLTAW